MTGEGVRERKEGGKQIREGRGGMHNCLGCKGNIPIPIVSVLSHCLPKHVPSYYGKGSKFTLVQCWSIKYSFLSR